MTAYESVKQTILEHHLINPGDVLLLGLSAGPDSSCLLYILCSLQAEMGFTLCALHVNHMIRGEDANEDERAAVQMCKDLCIPYNSVAVDIPALAKEKGISTEEMGRKERQRLLFEEKAKLENTYHGHAVKIVLAHNQDDQAETVMLRILRGTGVHGLAAMEYERADGIIRPLLDTKRIDIEKFCEEKHINPRIDKTNKENDYTRNKIRNILLPALEEYNPSIKDGLVRLAASAREDDEYIGKVVRDYYDKCRLSENTETISLDAKMVRGLDEAIYPRLIKLAFAKIGLTEDVASVHLSALKRALENNVGNKTIEFPRKYTAFLNKGIIEIRKPN